MVKLTVQPGSCLCSQRTVAGNGYINTTFLGINKHSYNCMGAKLDSGFNVAWYAELGKT